jgi:hypothetical protein
LRKSLFLTLPENDFDNILFTTSQKIIMIRSYITLWSGIF